MFGCIKGHENVPLEAEREVVNAHLLTIQSNKPESSNAAAALFRLTLQNSKPTLCIYTHTYTLAHV